MKKFSAITVALAWLLISSPAAYPQAKGTTRTPPPVAPTLVREGNFSMRLASGLKIGTAAKVSADLGLHILADTTGEYGEIPPPPTPQYPEPTVINNYYYRQGPPLITYYPPPSDYLYLYAWVPYPFWYFRFFFSGFFILHDFHKVSIINQRVVVVTNHVFHRHYRRFYKIDPVKRRWGKSLRGVAKSSHRRTLSRVEARRGPRAILQRSHDRLVFQRRLVNRKVAPLKSSANSKDRRRGRITPYKRAFSVPSAKRAKTSLHNNVQRAHQNPARFRRIPGGNQGRPSSLPPKGKRGFSGGLGKGGKHFSGKASKKLPGGSALKGAVKLPF
jgi:hypothetical protein